MVFERNNQCRLQRDKEIAVGRYWYQITEEGSPRGTEFPLTQVPWLNQTLLSTAIYYSMDDFESGYMATFQVWLKISAKIEAALNGAFKNAPYESTREFIGLNQAINQALLVSGFCHLYIVYIECFFPLTVECTPLVTLGTQA